MGASDLQSAGSGPVVEALFQRLIEETRSHHAEMMAAVTNGLEGIRREVELLRETMADVGAGVGEDFERLADRMERLEEDVASARRAVWAS